MPDKKITRRRFARITAAILPPLALLGSACKRKSRPDIPFSSCDDFSNVPESDQKLREDLAYVDHSPIEASTCENCNLWLPPQGEVACGGCTLFAGPVATEGYCTYWAPVVIAQ